MEFIPSNAEFMAKADWLAGVLEFPDEWMYGLSNMTYAIAKPAYDPWVLFIDNTMSNAAAYVAASPDAYLDPLTNPIAPLYAFLNWLNTFMIYYRHPIADNLPLVSIAGCVFAVLMYAVGMVIFFIIGKIMGPGRKYRPIGLVHNLFLFCLSLYMSVTILASAAASFGYTLWNNEISNSPGGPKNDWRLAKMMWVFYMSKLPEFMDTYLMLLKQNYRQVSFLHVYHHGSMVLVEYMVTNCAPGGDGYWSHMLNSAVHVVMYGYYFGTLAAQNEKGFVRRFLNRFKFMITRGQMMQFCVNCVQSVYCLYIAERCKSPRFLFIALFWYMTSMLVLFGNFLIKNSPSNNNNGKKGGRAVAANASPVFENANEKKKKSGGDPNSKKQR